MKMLLLTSFIFTSNAFAASITYDCVTSGGRKIFLQADANNLTSFKIDGQSVQPDMFSYNRDGEHIVSMRNYVNGKDLTIHFGSFMSEASTQVGFGNASPLTCKTTQEAQSPSKDRNNGF